MTALPESAEHETLLADSAADFCTRALKRERLRALRGATPGFERTAWRQMAELGWTEILLPAGAGGLGLGMRAAALVCRSLGAVAAPEPMIETGIAALTILDCLGAAPELLDAVRSGAKVLVPALGPGDGDAFAAVHATRHGGGHTLAGTLAQVPLGPDADAWLVPATSEGEPAWFLVPRNAGNVALAPLPLADGSHDARITFAGSEAGMLASGSAAREAALLARRRAELASSAYLLGLAEALFGITVEYTGHRTQFGQSIASFQVIQHRLVDLYLQLRLAAAVIDESCAEIDVAAGASASRAASRARFRACEAAQRVAREAVQMHGAIGYTDECDVVLYLHRTLVMSARYGNAGQHAARLADLIEVRDDGTTLAQVDAYLPRPAGGWNELSNDQFRAVVRGWFEAEYPPELRDPRRRLHWHECRAWYAKLHARGWAAPNWPAGHGGMGLSAEKLLIFIEERERHGVARTPDQGVIMVGPLLMQHGSAEQCEYWLPRALSGEHIWCQGYSEPGSGSDLASLRTAAVREGEEFVITGQKIWTTMAQDATHMFCLVRTDPQAKPQAGISFVLIDLQTPGITIRPIRNIAGDAEFCEVFLDAVRVPVANLVGKLHDGWTIAKALLGFERLFIGSPKTCQYALKRLRDLGAAHGCTQDPVFRDRYTRFAIDAADLDTLFTEFAAIVKRGETLGQDVSLLKIWASETFSRISEYLLDVAGEAGGRDGLVEFPGGTVDVLGQFFNARPTTIYGGANEIQRNILAKQVLGLPSK
ncbi:MAG: acyl-CoA dehydrogenase [Gammaproteobacteria bacterium]|nr:acyl-CoA dehydrogenase [Gammaproteobacteria bacterium]